MTPQKPAGLMIDPLVWVPRAISQNPAATAAADPLEDPPGVCPKFRGLRVNPGSEMANSVVTVFPTTTTPAFNNLVTQLA